MRASHQQLPDHRGRGWILGLLRCGGGCLRDAGGSRSTTTALVTLPVIGQALHGPLLQRRRRLAAALGGLAACRPERCPAYPATLTPALQCCSSHPDHPTAALLTTLYCRVLLCRLRRRAAHPTPALRCTQTASFCVPARMLRQCAFGRPAPRRWAARFSSVSFAGCVSGPCVDHVSSSAACSAVLCTRCLHALAAKLTRAASIPAAPAERG